MDKTSHPKAKKIAPGYTTSERQSFYQAREESGKDLLPHTMKGAAED